MCHYLNNLGILIDYIIWEIILKHIYKNTYAQFKIIYIQVFWKENKEGIEDAKYS